MGIYQEVLYKKFGKRSREALYYTVCFKMNFCFVVNLLILFHFIIASFAIARIHDVGQKHLGSFCDMCHQ